MQASNVGGLRAPRGPRVASAVALACWAVGVVVYAALPEGSTARYVAALVAYSASAAFVLVCTARATLGARGKERLLWGLLAVGLLVGLLSDLGWEGLQTDAFGSQAVSYQHAAYLVSYLLLLCAMTLLVSRTTKNITLLTFLDASSIMLSVGVLIWYFFLAGTDGTWAVLSRTMVDAALLFLSLVVLSTAGRPRFVGLLAAGFAAFALADGWYLGVRTENAYGDVGWPDMFWTLGFVFLGLAALRATPMSTSRQRIGPWRGFSLFVRPPPPPHPPRLPPPLRCGPPPPPGYRRPGGSRPPFLPGPPLPLGPLLHPPF